MITSGEEMTTGRLMEIKRRIREFLAGGRVVPFDDHSFRWGDRGVRFDDGDFEFEPLESGVFMKHNVDPPRWLHLGDFIAFEKYYIDPMATKSYRGCNELELQWVGIIGSYTLQEIANERRAARNKASE